MSFVPFHLYPNAWNSVSSDEEEGLEDGAETEGLEGVTGLGSDGATGLGSEASGGNEETGVAEACNRGDVMRISWRHEGQKTLLVNHWSIHTL